MWDAENFNKYSSKLTENFKGIVLKAPLILNVNCAKIPAKKFDFIACVKSIKKSFQMMHSNLCLSFRDTVPLSNNIMHTLRNRLWNLKKKTSIFVEYN